MDLQSQVFYRDQTLIFQPFVGHTRLGCQGFGKSVCPLAAQPDGYGQSQVASEPGQPSRIRPCLWLVLSIRSLDSSGVHAQGTHTP